MGGMAGSVPTEYHRTGGKRGAYARTRGRSWSWLDETVEFKYRNAKKLLYQFDLRGRHQSQP